MKKLLILILIVAVLLVLGIFFIFSCTSDSEPELDPTPDSEPDLTPEPDTAIEPGLDHEPPFTTLETVRVFKPKNDPSTVILPDPTNENLPAWRGFNKLNLFSLGESAAYDDNGTAVRETDFVLMHELGFNFVRFPMDYRFFYCKENKTFDMEKQVISFPLPARRFAL